jgi:hypothetical protein
MVTKSIFFISIDADDTSAKGSNQIPLVEEITQFLEQEHNRAFKLHQK